MDLNTASGNALGSIASLPPAISEAQAAAVLKVHYDLDARLTPLVSERDQNFHVQSDAGEFVFKVANADELDDVTDMQIEVLDYLQQQAPDLAVARLIRTTDQQRQLLIVSQAREYRARLLSWLPGTPLGSGPMTEARAASAGHLLARLGAALRHFRHPGESQELLWDIRRAPALRELTEFIRDAKIRALVEQSIVDFERRAHSGLTQLQQQVIHNDGNPGNLLLDDADCVAGVIDFGDMVRAPLIVDVAVAAAYLRTGPENPARYVAAFVDGYQSIRRLTGDEAELLFDLVRARLATTTTILHWRLADRADDDPYRQQALANESSAAEFLQLLTDMRRRQFLQAIGLAY